MAEFSNCAVPCVLPSRTMTTSDETFIPQGRTSSVRSTLRWFAPYLRGQRTLMVGVMFAIVVLLAAQTLLPLVVEELLHHGSWEMGLGALLVALVVIQLVSAHLSHLGGHHLANLGGHALRQRVFARTLASDTLHQSHMVRSSIVSRHTSDVDRVAEGFEATLISGVPGVARVVLSLGMLIVLEWRAGLAMAVAATAFAIYRRQLGHHLLRIDRARADASSRTGASVDESITGALTIRGLHLEPWQQKRFSARSHRLEEVSGHQGRATAWLFTGAHLTGLAGLVVVVVFALIAGGESLAAVAAAILYVEGVVRGLEALPPWMRSVQMAAVSEVRIDQILDLEDRTTVPAPGSMSIVATRGSITLDRLTTNSGSGLSLNDTTLTLPAGQIIGLVTPVGSEPDTLLALMAGDSDPQSGCILLDGLDVRMPGVGERIAFVPTEATAFDASILDQLHAVDPDLDAARALALLDEVGLGHLAELPAGLNTVLGHSGMDLTLAERQRFALAVALAAQPDVLLIGPILALAESETALPLIDRLRSSTVTTVVLGVRSADVADAVDAMMFIEDGDLSLDSHQSLLASNHAYTDHWLQRLTPGAVDLSVLGIDDSRVGELQTRLVTETYAAGDLIYRQGEPADRIVFTVSGRVEITIDGPDGPRRVAILGPGNHCGDLRLRAGERRPESARALDDCVVRTLSREAISAGMMGMLERSPLERRILASALRHGSFTIDQLRERFPELTSQDIDHALTLLTGDGAVRCQDGTYTVVHRSNAKVGAASVLDQLSDL